MRKNLGIISTLLLFLMVACGTGKKNIDDWQAYKQVNVSSQRWDRQVKAGFAYYKKGKLHAAYHLLKAAFKLGCLDTLVLYKIAFFKERLGEYESAKRIYLSIRRRLKRTYPEHRYNAALPVNLNKISDKIKQSKKQ